MKDRIKKIKLTLEIESIDIPTMNEMTDEEYRKFLQNYELFYTDHHNVLRSSVSDHPLATKLSQLIILIEELEKMHVEMV